MEDSLGFPVGKLESEAKACVDQKSRKLRSHKMMI